MLEVEGGSRAAAPKGSMTYVFTHMENFLLHLLAIGIWAFGLGFRPWGWDLDLGAGIWILGLGFGPRGRDLGLEAGIWASRMGFGPLG